MQTPDEQLRGRIRRAAPSPADNADLLEVLGRRRSARAVRRRAGTAVLAAVVVIGSVAGVALLTRAFRGDGNQPAVMHSTGINGPLVAVEPTGDEDSRLVLFPEAGGNGYPVTPGGGLVSDPAAAPDGRSIVFVQGQPDDDVGVSGDLMLMDLATGSISMFADGSFSDPAWSPDGSRIAAVDSAEGIGLVVIDIATGSIDHPAAGVHPSWSPDGSEIVYEVPDVWRVLPDGTGIFVVPAEGGSSTRIADDGGAPTWSPDGGRIAYERPGGVWTMAPDGSDRDLVAGIDPDMVGSADLRYIVFAPGWSPDGSLLTYQATGSGHAWIEANRLDGSATWQLTEGTDHAWLPIADPPLDLAEPPTPPVTACEEDEITGDFDGDAGLDVARIGCSSNAWQLEFEWDNGALGVGRVPCEFDCRFWAVADLDGDGRDELIIRSSWVGVRDGAEWYPMGFLLILQPYAWETFDWESAWLPVQFAGPDPKGLPSVRDLGTDQVFPIGTEATRAATLSCEAGALTWRFSWQRIDGTATWMARTLRFELRRGELHIVDGPTEAPAEAPTQQATELCGAPILEGRGSPEPIAHAGPSIEAGLCDVSTLEGDFDGEGTLDLLVIGTEPDGSTECPPDGERRLRIDLFSDGSINEADPPDCSTWCSPFAAVDIDGDGKDEIFLNEGHTTPPASAVIGIYTLAPSASVEPYLAAIPFPNGTNTFPLVNSYQGYEGAFCTPEAHSFTTWRGRTDPGGSLDRITYRSYTLDRYGAGFVLQDGSAVDTTIFPPEADRGYDGAFCGEAAEPPG